MKKTILLSLVLIIALSIESCKQDPKKKDVKTTEIKKELSINTEKSSINWTAYKTTDKIPVKGKFTKFNIESTENSGSIMELLNGLKFSIPVSSLSTNDTIRDQKLVKFFFGTLQNSMEISGTISTETDTSGNVELFMNGIWEKLPITISKEEGIVKLNALMNLGNWKAQAALKAINVACFDLHKGPDGISKTWDEVTIEVSLAIQ